VAATLGDPSHHDDMEDGKPVATRQDFTDEEWAALQKGLMGSGTLVSVSDRDLTDTFGEASALSKYLASQQVAATNELVRELAKTRGTTFGLTTSPEQMRADTIAALTSAVGTLGAKAPDDLGPYRELVLGLAQSVADAKGGEVPIETAMIASIREALGAD
jgi:hypothetical protein